MDIQSIIKAHIGKEITHKITREKALISSVGYENNEFYVYVSNNETLEKLNFMQFVSTYNLYFSLQK